MPPCRLNSCHPSVGCLLVLYLSLYKRFVYFEAIVHESTIRSLTPAAHLYCPPWCNTIPQLLDSIRLPSDLPLVCYTPYNIDNGNIV